MLIVMSSHDFNDNPKFTPLNPRTYPQTSPKLAILDGIIRYLPRYLSKIFPSKDDPHSETVQEITTKGIDDATLLFELARRSVPHVFVFNTQREWKLNLARKRMGINKFMKRA